MCGGGGGYICYICPVGCTEALHVTRAHTITEYCPSRPLFSVHVLLIHIVDGIEVREAAGCTLCGHHLCCMCVYVQNTPAIHHMLFLHACIYMYVGTDSGVALSRSSRFTAEPGSLPPSPPTQRYSSAAFPVVTNTCYCPVLH